MSVSSPEDIDRPLTVYEALEWALRWAVLGQKEIDSNPDKYDEDAGEQFDFMLEQARVTLAAHDEDVQEIQELLALPSAVRDAIKRALDDMNAGRLRPWREVFEEIEQQQGAQIVRHVAPYCPKCGTNAEGGVQERIERAAHKWLGGKDGLGKLGEQLYEDDHRKLVSTFLSEFGESHD